MLWALIYACLVPLVRVTSAQGVTCSEEGFLQWLTARGATAFASLANFTDMGRGLVAKSALGAGDVILHAPPSLVITQRHLASAWPDMLEVERSIFAALPGDVAIASFLMKERFLGPASEWSPYLACLPQDVPHTASFGASELAALDEPRLQAEAAQRWHATQRTFKAVKPSIARVLGEEAAQGAACSLERFRWAMSMVDSRALTIRGEKMLVPLADMTNHKPHPERRAGQAGEFFAKSHVVGADGAMTVLADRPFAAGEQIFEDYGDNSDQIYLDYHGFVPAEANPFDCVWLDLHLRDGAEATTADTAALIEADIAARASFLAALHLPAAAGTLQACVTASAELATPQMLAAAVWSLPEAAFSECARLVNSARRSGRASGGLSACESILGAHKERTYALVWRAVAAAACRRLNRYSTSADADAALLATAAGGNGSSGSSSSSSNSSSSLEPGDAPTLSSHKRMAVAYRLRKKRLLADVILTAGAALQLPAEQQKQPGSGGVGAICRQVVASSSAASAEGAQVDPLVPLVAAFNDWMDGVGCPVKKLRAVAVPGMRLGAVATAPIAKEEPYLSVPEWATLSADTAREDPVVGPAVAQLAKELGAYGWDDDFDPLLLLLVHEAFARRERGTHWPYVALLPSPDEMETPLFFAGDDLARLAGSDMAAAAARYRAADADAFERKWRRAEPLLADLLPPVQIGRNNGVLVTRERHAWATAMLDSRSIWWGGKRHLVPLLDLVNCAAAPDNGNGKGRAHVTRAVRSRSAGAVAETRAAWAFEAGSQVFENYGQPNHVYFLYHGFSLQRNPHDCVYVSAASLADEVNRRNDAEDQVAAAERRRVLEERFGRADARRSFCVAADRVEPPFVAYVLAAAGLPIPETKGGRLLDGEGRAAVAAWARRRLLAYPRLPPPLTPAAERVSEFVQTEIAALAEIAQEFERPVLAHDEL